MPIIETWLSGKKTYILGAAALLTIVSYWGGIIDASTANSLLSVFGFGAVITLRAAIAKTSGV